MTPDDCTTDITQRHTVESLHALKLKLLERMNSFRATEREIEVLFQQAKGHTPYDVNERIRIYSEQREEKYIDQTCWKYLVGLFHLNRYMLCTEYEKLLMDIENFNTPVFSPETARAWLAGLSDLINDNVKTLIHQVFAEITEGTYHTGSGYNAPRKKRNNNGIDKNFILYTNDWSSMFGYWSSKPTITDDLEKVCYIIAGRQLPDRTAKETMRDAKSKDYDGEFFTLRTYQNGNTHFTLADEIRQKLNLYGPTGAIIGENIKIKIIERLWR